MKLLRNRGEYQVPHSACGARSVGESGVRRAATRGSLHALAFAANQDTGHGVGRLASLGEGGVGAVPAGMICVVAGGTALAVAALAGGSAVQDDLARGRRPGFVG